MRKTTLIFLLFTFVFLSAQQKPKTIQIHHNGWSTPYYYYLKHKPISVLNQYYFKASTTQKVVALTFDDGYLPNTSNVMEYLKKNKIPATFFILMGRKVMTKEMFDKYSSPLFEVGMHSFFHDDYRKVTNKKIKTDILFSIQRANSRCKYKKFRYFRPPYGVVNTYATEILKQNNLTGILWSTDSRDWAGLKGQKLVDNVMSDLGCGSIILMHDNINVNDLDLLCKEIKRKGFQIVSMSKMVSYKKEFPN